MQAPCSGEGPRPWHVLPRTPKTKRLMLCEQTLVPYVLVRPILYLLCSWFVQLFAMQIHSHILSAPTNQSQCTRRFVYNLYTTSFPFPLFFSFNLMGIALKFFFNGNWICASSPLYLFIGGKKLLGWEWNVSRWKWKSFTINI